MNPLDSRRLDVLVALHERTSLDLPDVLIAADWVLGGTPKVQLHIEGAANALAATAVRGAK